MNEIKKLKKQLKISNKRIGELVGLTESAICRKLNGNRPMKEDEKTAIIEKLKELLAAKKQINKGKANRFKLV